jgi:hypothetical protein
VKTTRAVGLEAPPTRRVTVRDRLLRPVMLARLERSYPDGSEGWPGSHSANSEPSHFCESSRAAAGSRRSWNL